MIGNSAFSNSENAVLTLFNFNPILKDVKIDYRFSMIIFRATSAKRAMFLPAFFVRKA